MAGIAGIGERHALDPARRRITRNDVQVHVAILVLQKYVVEVIRLEGGLKPGRGAGDHQFRRPRHADALLVQSGRPH